MSNIENQVINDIQRRSALGLQKYGVTMDRQDLSHKEWLQHAYEEALDLAIYLKKAITDYDTTL